MIQVASGTRVYLACAPVDMRLGVSGLCAAVARILNSDAFSGSLFIFRSKKGNYLKIVYFDGSGVCLFAKKMERHRFIWPRTVDAQLSLSPAQMSLLIEGFDWAYGCPGRTAQARFSVTKALAWHKTYAQQSAL